MEKGAGWHVKASVLVAALGNEVEHTVEKHQWPLTVLCIHALNHLT